MIFTNNDLKRFRSELTDLIESRQNPSITLSGNEAKALLARLEAAEAALEIYVASEGDVIAGENVLIEWRKSKGEI